jgi:hypothetical protein
VTVRKLIKTLVKVDIALRWAYGFRLSAGEWRAPERRKDAKRGTPYVESISGQLPDSIDPRNGRPAVRVTTYVSDVLPSWDPKTMKMAEGPNATTGGGSLTPVYGTLVEINQFFTEWVTYPLQNRLKKVFEKADDLVRVLDPNILPEWQLLEEVWASLKELEETTSPLPTTIDFIRRCRDERSYSTKVVTLWRSLRAIILKGVTLTDQLSTETRAWPKAERRRAGG